MHDRMEARQLLLPGGGHTQLSPLLGEEPERALGK